MKALSNVRLFKVMAQRKVRTTTRVTKLPLGMPQTLINALSNVCVFRFREQRKGHTTIKVTKLPLEMPLPFSFYILDQTLPFPIPGCVWLEGLKSLNLIGGHGQWDTNQGLWIYWQAWQPLHQRADGKGEILLVESWCGWGLCVRLGWPAHNRMTKL